MELIIKTVLGLLNEHKYIFAFLGALFEGTFIMILAGVFYKLGFFKFWGVISVLIIGYLANALMYYLIGRIGGSAVLEKWGKRRHLTSGLVKKIEDYFQKHSGKAIFLTRITYGFSSIVMIMSGSFKMKIKKYLAVNFFATIIWVGALFGLGYVFGTSYKALGAVAKSIAIGLAIIISLAIIFISVFIIFWLRRLARTKFVKNLENHPYPFLRRIGNLITKAFNNKKMAIDKDFKRNKIEIRHKGSEKD